MKTATVAATKLQECSRDQSLDFPSRDGEALSRSMNVSREDNDQQKS